MNYELPEYEEVEGWLRINYVPDSRSAAAPTGAFPIPVLHSIEPLPAFLLEFIF